jgi:hypothetical protein
MNKKAEILVLRQDPEQQQQKGLRMKLSALRKTTPVRFNGPDGQVAEIYVRAADAEFILKGAEEEAKIRARLNLEPGDDLPLAANLEAGLMARLGTVVTGWSDDWESDAGEPIPAKLSDGSLNEAGGYEILRVTEVINAVNTEVERQRKAVADAKEAAAKNSPGPFAVN